MCNEMLATKTADELAAERYLENASVQYVPGIGLCVMGTDLLGVDYPMVYKSEIPQSPFRDEMWTRITTGLRMRPYNG